MSNHTYPRIGDKRKVTGRERGHRCQMCQKPAKHRVEIQVSIFRGDDDVVFVCEESTKQILAWFSNQAAHSSERDPNDRNGQPWATANPYNK